MTTMTSLLAHPVGSDPTDPPLTTPPTGAWSTLPVMVNTVTDQTAPDGPPLPAGLNTNGIVRIDQTVGGSTGMRNILTWATGLSKRPAAFLRENWQSAPMPFNRLQGRVGYQRAADELAVRVAVADATALPTSSETLAAATSPSTLDVVTRSRGRRFG